MTGRDGRRTRRLPGGRSPRQARRVERGVGLIEVLIAVLVLSIGFLAAGGMQVQAMRNNQEAYHDSQAQLLLADMVDRMRSNPDGVRAGNYTGATTAGLTIDTGACRASACTPAALAARDLSVWAASLDPQIAGVAPRLPPSSAAAGSDSATPAVGSIAADANGVFTLTLSWQALADGAMVDRTASAVFVP